MTEAEHDSNTMIQVCWQHYGAVERVESFKFLGVYQILLLPTVDTDPGTDPVQWGEQVFDTLPILQVFLLTKHVEVCKNPENHIVWFLSN